MSNLRVPINYTGGYTSADLVTHMAKSTTTLCACFYTVAPIGGTVVAMTSYSSDLTGVPGYPGVTFKHTTGVSASKTEDYSGNQAGQMEVDVFLKAAGITEADFVAGKWAHAPATLFVCNYEALNMGQMIMKSGFLGELRQIGIYAQAEIKGLNNALTAQIGTVTRPECPYDVGDSDCTKDMTSFTHSSTITNVTSTRVFRSSGLAGTGDSEYYKNGKITFTSGDNSGYQSQIESWNDSTGEFTLRRAMPYLPVNGNGITAIAGCQKRFQTDCVTKFSNGVNFGGDAFVQTYEQFTALPQN